MTSQPTNADMLSAIRELIDEIRGLRADINPPPPGPARGLSTAIRSSPDYRHRTGYRMGFAPAQVTNESETEL